MAHMQSTLLGPKFNFFKTLFRVLSNRLRSIVGVLFLTFAQVLYHLFIVVYRLTSATYLHSTTFLVWNKNSVLYLQYLDIIVRCLCINFCWPEVPYQVNLTLWRVRKALSRNDNKHKQA